MLRSQADMAIKETSWQDKLKNKEKELLDELSLADPKSLRKLTDTWEAKSVNKAHKKRSL